MEIRDRDIERVAAELGRAAADNVDADRVADTVVRRLRAAPPATRTPAWRWVSVAAALALAAGATWLSFTSPPNRTTAPRVAALHVLDPLSADELGEVLDSLTFQAPVSEHVTHGLDDLNERQLRELLAAMEG